MATALAPEKASPKTAGQPREAHPSVVQQLEFDGALLLMRSGALCSSPVDLHAAVSQQLDDLFARYLALYSSIRSHRAASSAALKAGFFQLAEARHSTPQYAFDSNSYSGRDMLPTVATRCRSAKEETTDEKAASVGASRNSSLVAPVRFELAEVEMKDVIASSGGSEEGDDDGEDDDLEEMMRQEERAVARAALRQRKGVAPHDVDANAAGSSKSSGSFDPLAPLDDITPAHTALDLRQQPVHWFGALIPASLPASAASFRGALEPLMQIATLAQEMQVLEAKFVQLRDAQTKAREAKEPGAEEELRKALDQLSVDGDAQ